MDEFDLWIEDEINRAKNDLRDRGWDEQEIEALDQAAQSIDLFDLDEPTPRYTRPYPRSYPSPAANNTEPWAMWDVWTNLWPITFAVAGALLGLSVLGVLNPSLSFGVGAYFLGIGSVLLIGTGLIVRYLYDGFWARMVMVAGIGAPIMMAGLFEADLVILGLGVFLLLAAGAAALWVGYLRPFFYPATETEISSRGPAESPAKKSGVTVPVKAAKYLLGQGLGYPRVADLLGTDEASLRHQLTAGKS